MPVDELVEKCFHWDRRMKSGEGRGGRGGPRHHGGETGTMQSLKKKLAIGKAKRESKLTKHKKHRHHKADPDLMSNKHASTNKGKINSDTSEKNKSASSGSASPDASGGQSVPVEEGGTKPEGREKKRCREIKKKTNIYPPTRHAGQKWIPTGTAVLKETVPCELRGRA